MSAQACTMEAALKSAVVTLEEPILADAAGNGATPGEPELPAERLVVEPRTACSTRFPSAIGGYALSADGLTLSAYFVGGVDTCYARPRRPPIGQPMAS